MKSRLSGTIWMLTIFNGAGIVRCAGPGLQRGASIERRVHVRKQWPHLCRGHRRPRHERRACMEAGRRFSRSGQRTRGVL